MLEDVQKCPVKEFTVREERKFAGNQYTKNKNGRNKQRKSIVSSDARS